PMLEVLRGADVSDTVAVVTRWFGGILLGAGGLVRAYGDAVRAGLDAVGIREREERTLLLASVSHATAGRFESDLRTRHPELVVLERDYGADGVGFTLAAAEPGPIVGTIAEVTAASASVEKIGTQWVDL